MLPGSGGGALGAGLCSGFGGGRKWPCGFVLAEGAGIFADAMDALEVPGCVVVVGGGGGGGVDVGGGSTVAATLTEVGGAGVVAFCPIVLLLTIRTTMKTSIAIAIAARSHAKMPVDGRAAGAMLFALIGAVGGVVHALRAPVYDGLLGAGCGMIGGTEVGGAAVTNAGPKIAMRSSEGVATGPA